MLLHHLQQLLAVQGTVRYVEAAAGTPDVWATWADTASAEHELGFKGKTELYQGLQEFVEWYWSDPVA
jgi:nucleoside-diphosphate-sugar epimerase